MLFDWLRTCLYFDKDSDAGGGCSIGNAESVRPADPELDVWLAGWDLSRDGRARTTDGAPVCLLAPAATGTDDFTVPTG